MADGSVLYPLDAAAELEMFARALDRWHRAERIYRRSAERLRRMEIACCKRHIQCLRVCSEPYPELIAEIEQMVYALEVGEPLAARQIVARERMAGELRKAREQADKLAKATDAADDRYLREQIRQHEARLRGARRAA